MSKTFAYRDVTKGFIFEDGARVVFPLMKRKRSLLQGGLSDYISGPPYTYGGPITDKDLSSHQLNEILEYIISAFKCYNSILIRGNPFGLPMLPTGFNEVKDLSYIIELYKYNNERDLLKSYSERISTDINKAKKSNIVIKKASAVQDYEDLYALYKKASAHWIHDLTNYPLALFQNVCRLKNINIDFWTAYHNNKMIGGDIVLTCNKISNWWLSYYDREYSKYFARRYVLHQILMECRDKGITFYDLGVGSGLKGIEFYKKSMGGEEFPHSAWIRENTFLKSLRNFKRIIVAASKRIHRDVH